MNAIKHPNNNATPIPTPIPTPRPVLLDDWDGGATLVVGEAVVEKVVEIAVEDVIVVEDIVEVTGEDEVLEDNEEVVELEDEEDLDAM